MAESDFVFESGEPIDVGNPVENNYVEESGELVSDGDISQFVFISGRGFGAGTVKDGRLTVYDGLSEDDPIITTVGFNIDEQNAPQVGQEIPIGFFSSDGDQKFDNIRAGDGTLIEDFNDCGSVTSYFDSADRGNSGSVPTTDDWQIAGSGDCYLTENNTGLSAHISSSVGAGLQNYPNWGQTVLAEVYVSSGKDAGITLGGDASSWGFRASCAGEQNFFPFEGYAIRGSWVANNIEKDFNVPTGWQLWKLEFF